MKKIILSAICLLFVNVVSFSQQENTMPENGNVGLGTLTPSAKLDVNGNVHIDSMLMVKDSILIQKNARVKNNLKVEGDISLPNLNELDSLNTSRDILIYDKDNDVIKSLELSKLNEYLYDQNCNQKLDEFGNALSPTWSNGLNKIFVDCPQVFVGIATSEPKYNLDVRGTSYTTRMSVGVLTGDPIEGFFNLKSYYPQNYDENIFVVQNTGRKVFQINNNGLVQAREIKVDLDAWPDYVFDVNYKLMPLKDLKVYLSKYKHLPNIPDAKTIETSGVNVGEMSKLSIQKIEELTLYLLQQQEMIDKQAKLLEEQAKKIAALEELYNSNK